MSSTPPDPEYVLRGVTGAVFGRSYHLLAPTTVGRAPECDVVLDNRGISRQHAKLRPLEYGVEIEDLKSTNGCFLNGQRITLAIALVGDEIAFDELRFRVGAAPRTAPNSADQGARKKSAGTSKWPWIVAALVAVGALVAFAGGWIG